MHHGIPESLSRRPKLSIFALPSCHPEPRRAPCGRVEAALFLRRPERSEGARRTETLHFVQGGRRRPSRARFFSGVIQKISANQTNHAAKKRRREILRYRSG
jgi:hypothetical protein